MNWGSLQYWVIALLSTNLWEALSSPPRFAFSLLSCTTICEALSNPPGHAAKDFKFHALSNWVSRVSSNFLMHCWPFANLVENLVFYACWGCFGVFLSSACCLSVNVIKLILKVVVLVISGKFVKAFILWLCCEYFTY